MVASRTYYCPAFPACRWKGTVIEFVKDIPSAEAEQAEHIKTCIIVEVPDDE